MSIRPRHRTLFAAALPAAVSLVFGGCSGTDETWVTDVPVAVDTLSPNADAPPRETGAQPDAGSAVAPLDEDDIDPVTPATPLDAGATVDAAPPTVAFDCTALPAVPATFETHEGFTSSEDFVFDELGNVVGVDDNGNLVRVSKGGERQLWVPAIGLVAGMVALPDGSVVLCDVEEGALKRAYPNGTVRVLLGGLLYPNGVDIGPDGFIYVAENAGGRVRRVDPETGEFSIAALGLHGPNGVAFSDDPSLFYVGSFEGSGVYEIELSEPGALGRASIFARPAGATLREPIIACPDNQQGVDCETEWYGPGKCQVLANVIDCLPFDRCSELPEGAECVYPVYGTCQQGRCVEPPNPCDGRSEGAACEDPSFGAGVCRTSYGALACIPPNACDGLEAGAACENPSLGAGTCVESGGILYCGVPDPCEGRSVGDDCEDPGFGAGECLALGQLLYCNPKNPCAEASVGDACEHPYSGPGQCEAEGASLYCAPVNGCDGLARGDACSDFFIPEGTCAGPDEALFCTPPNACDTLTEGAACEEFGLAAVCVDISGHLFCTQPNVCDSLTEGAPCSDEFAPEGVCTDYGSGRLYCAPPNPCYGLEAGAACTDPTTGVGDGVCTDTAGPLGCLSASCLGTAEGADCEDPLIGAGQCFGGICSSNGVSGGGIDGMGVDACGNVYATEFTSGNVWRISPERKVERLVVLPSSWIPNVKWGRDRGGFSSRVMYVADRDEGRLFGVAVGVPGATEFFAKGP